MDCGLDVLGFAHTLVDCDTLLVIKAASLYALRQGLKTDRKGGSPFKGSEKIMVVQHVPGQLVGKGRQLLSVRLRHIIHAYHMKFRYDNFLFFFDGLSVLPDNGFPGFRVGLIHFLFYFLRGENAYSFFIFFHITPDSRVFPCVIAHDMGSVRGLHGNQYGIV